MEEWEGRGEVFVHVCTAIWGWEVSPLLFPWVRVERRFGMLGMVRSMAMVSATSDANEYILRFEYS